MRFLLKERIPVTARKITQNNSNIEKKIPAIGVIINVIKIFHGIDVVAFSKEKLFKQSLFTSSVFFLFCISSCQITSKYLMKLSILSP